MAPKKTTKKSAISPCGHNRFGMWHQLFRAVMVILAIAGGVASLELIIPRESAAQFNEESIGETIRDPDQPWQVEADEINYDQNLDEVTATGNVLIYKGNIKLLADFVRFDHKNMMAYAEGEVVLTNGEDILSGTSMEMDLENQDGSVKDGYLFLKLMALYP